VGHVRIVADTDVVVAAMRSPSGASAAILRFAREGSVTLLLSVPLALEYESICMKAEHRLAAGLTEGQAGAFVPGLIAVSEPIGIHFLWRPQLRDPNDEMVLEVAVNGQADAIVTFNVRDFGDIPRQLGMDLLLPRDAVRRIRQ
jgi:putative PIN family toxin of toxin-antitoxin system